MKQSAGTLLYRKTGHGLEVLIVHPSGPYNRRAPWSIPKGELEPGDDLESTARRETEEETGVTPQELHYLGYIDYRRSRKRVHCFAGAAPPQANAHPASWEVDRAEFVPIEQARELLHPDQRAFIDRLLQQLGQSETTT